MPEFLELLPPGAALETFLAHLGGAGLHTSPGGSQEVSIEEALGRVTARPLLAPHPLPTFTRSTVDGYAVSGADTHGASDSQPGYLRLAGEVPMGTAPGFSVPRGAAALIHTGGMLPDGTDAVIMLEYTQPVSSREIEIQRAVAAGENTIAAGEDVHAGQEVIAAGVRLRPAELGGLAALGITQVPVVRQPVGGLLSTGDEVVPASASIQPGQVRDVNTSTLSGLIRRAGGVARSYGILPDKIEALEAAARKAIRECDFLVITAGSSASTRDLTAEVINRLGKPGVLVHGVNVRPGKPTILAVCDGKAVVGLPGNPVSALVIAQLFIVPLVHRLLGEAAVLQPALTARLSLNLPSQAGREDWTPVRLLPTPDGYLAEPVFGKSNLIFSLVRADGLVRTPPDATGLEAGASVEVILL